MKRKADCIWKVQPKRLHVVQVHWQQMVLGWITLRLGTTSMKSYSRSIFLLLSILIYGGCSKTETANYSYSTPTTVSNSSISSASTASTPASTPNQGLTNSKVEIAVEDLLSDWKMGGSISVQGIQENSQTNSAVADLQFNDFEYGVTFQGQLLRKNQFKVPAKSGNPIPPTEEMFPPRKVKYSKDGRATLSKYNDGRWVLKSVNWGFDTGVKGSIEIR